MDTPGTIVKEVTVNAPVEKVWKALTDKNQMKQWYFDIPDFEPVVGCEFSFIGQDQDCVDYVHLCKVTEVIPNKKFSHSWRYKGYDGDSQVTWELFAEGKNTRVKLTHTGLDTFPPVKAFARENFNEGWTAIVGSMLPEFVEEGSTAGGADINATAEKVWDVLTQDEYIRQWAAAFSPGTYAKTDWKEGSEITWYDGENKIGAKGVVLVNDKPSVLKIGYYDDLNSTPPAPLGAYNETFTLTENNGKTRFTFEGGLLSMKYVKAHEPMWKEAIAKIKQLAEQ